MESIFGIGLAELFFIMIIALIVLGPERLPGAIRQIAGLVRQVHAISNELSSQFSEEIKVLEELNPKNLLNEFTKDLDKPETKDLDKPDTNIGSHKLGSRYIGSDNTENKVDRQDNYATVSHSPVEENNEDLSGHTSMEGVHAADLSVIASDSQVDFTPESEQELSGKNVS